MFKKDLLILDVETTGLDFTKHEVIQIAAILLDKKTLKQKKVFNEFIKPTKWRNRDPESMAINGISLDILKNAPSLKTVLQKFRKTFGNKVTLTPYGTILDTLMLRIAFKQCGMKYDYDYHVFDVWPLLYTYMAKKRLLNNPKYFAGFSLDDAAKHFKIKVPNGRHTALVDCQIEADILRRLVKAIKI